MNRARQAAPLAVFAHRGARKDGVDFTPQPLDDLRGQVRRAEERHHDVTGTSRSPSSAIVGTSGSSELRRGVRTAERAQLAFLHVGQAEAGGGEHILDAPGKEIRQRRRLALVGNVQPSAAFPGA
jgi:hypothetical protein